MSAQRRFAPGDCYAVVSATAIVVLPAAERARVGALWELADSGASPSILLDSLLRGGLSDLRDFAWMGEGEGTTRLIVRGSATARVSSESGDQILSAASGLMWQEATLSTNSRVRISLADAATAEHSLLPGISRVRTVEWDTSTEADAADEPIQQPIAVEPGAVEPAAVESAAVEPAVEETIVEDQFVETPVVAAPVIETPGVEAPVIETPFIDAVPTDAEGEAAAVDPEPVVEATMSSDSPPAGPAADEPAAVVGEDWSDRDGHTVIGAPTPQFDRPPIPGQEIAPDVVSHPVASLVFSTGDVIAVDRTVLIGRAPEARQFASHDQPHVVTVSSPHQEISSTHLEIRPGAGADHGSAIATDLGSTNGTLLVQPGLAPEELQPGIAVSLIPGAVLDLGDGVTIQVTDP